MIDPNTKTGATVNAMFKFGGGFVRGIAQLWSIADLANKARIEAAFKAEFDFYLAMARASQNESEPTL